MLRMSDRGVDERAGRRAAPHDALYEMLARLYRAESIAQVYEAALDAICDGLGCARASILQFDDAGVMRFVAARGLSDGYRGKVEGHSPWKMGDRDPEPLCVHDILDSDESEDLKATINAEGIRGLCFIPLVAERRVIGKFMAYYPHPHDFSRAELNLAVAIALQLSFAIERVQADEKQREAEEQLRAANELLEVRVRERTSELLTAYEQLRRQSKEREAAEAEALATGEQFQLLVEGVVDYAIYMLDRHGHVSTWNAGARRAKGYGDAEIIGRHFSVFYTDEARAAGEPERALHAARENGRTEMQGWRVRKDGSQFWAHVIIDGIFNEQDELIGYAKVTRDTTEQRRAEQSLEQAREALFHSQKMDAVGQLTGGIAHDFNNMLAGIIGALQMLERRMGTGRIEDARRYLGVATESANRAAALTARLLAFGRRQSLDVKPTDIVSTILSMELLLRRTVRENVVISFDVEGGDLWARTDAHQLESAILNLALNARDAMADGGRLTIGVRRADRFQDKDGDFVVIEVADTGAGMPADVAARAFEPFFTTKPMGAGTGLGLSMVYGFMNQSGGHAEIESAEGAGARVRLYLPATAAGEVVAEKPSVVPEGRGENVLIVEDEPSVRLLVVDVLRDLGYRPREAANADEAIPILESDARIDLMISDVGLPGLNGRQLADIARSHRPELKVLFLTGYAEHAAVRGDFLIAGMDLMKKPFAVEDLAARVQEMVRG